MSVANKVRESGLILGGLGVIGFLGVVWLMIYGNLSGNLGFTQDSTLTSVQELILNSSAEVTFSGTVGKTNPSVSSVLVINATGGETITAINYTLTSTTIIGSGIIAGYNNTAVNVSYTTSYDSQGLINTEGVISNVTGGFATFFGFSNTFFTIAAIVLLIFMLVGLLAIVMQIAQGYKKKKGSGYSD